MIANKRPNPTKVIPAPPSSQPPPPAQDRSEVEQHIHDVIDEFEHGVGRKATQAEVASIISAVTEHQPAAGDRGDTGTDTEDDDDFEIRDDAEHDHAFIAKRKASRLSNSLATGNDSLSLAEDELEQAEAQFELLSRQLSDAADMHGDSNMLRKAKTTEKDRFVAEKDEGLGDNFRDTPWLVPSVAEAMKHRRYAMFASGYAPVCGTGTHDLASFGIGISLYLRLLKALSISFLIMTFLSLPSYCFSTAGSKIPVEDRDALGFSLVSIGNIGDSAAESMANQIILNGTLVSTVSAKAGTIPSLLGFPEYRLNEADASFILVVCDILCCIVFFFLALWLKNQIEESESGSGKETLSASDYSVYVRGLPEDATRQEITAHFSNLFALDQPDWSNPGYCCCLHIWQKKSRLPEDITDKGSLMYDEAGNEILLVQTVTFGKTDNIDNTRDDLYLGTWVAETTVIHPNSELIIQYQKQKKINLKLMTARAHVKKYARGTPDPKGPNPKKEAKWMTEVGKYSAHHEHAERSISRHQSRVDYKMRACSGAFVTFQHEESFLRALADYRRARTCMGRCLQPKELRFRPKRGTENPKQNMMPLVVTQADEPTNIIWEHLNTTNREINIRRCCTLMPCLLFLIIAMLVVFYVQDQGKLFKESTPSMAACALDIPASYMESYDAVTAAASAVGADGVVSAEGLIPFYDKELTKSSCPRGKHYISYRNTTLNASGWTEANAEDYERGISDVNYTSTAQPLCVNPCVGPNEASTCQTLACKDNPRSALCRTFTKNSVVGCYCKGRLEVAIRNGGYNQEVLDEFTKETNGVCDVFLGMYVANIGLSIGMTVLIVVVNGLLRIFLTMLARSEHHHSEGAESSAISIKVFAATFMNTAVTMLVVNAAFQNIFPEYVFVCSSLCLFLSVCSSSLFFLLFLFFFHLKNIFFKKLCDLDPDDTMISPISHSFSLS